MSYILDALKKSEQERDHGAIPALQTPPPRKVRRRSLWAGMGIGAAALVSVAAIAWLVVLEWHRAGAPPAGETQASGSRPQAVRSEAADPAKEAPAVQSDSSPAVPVVTHGASLEELGPEARARIEGLSVNVVSYSDVPERRFIMLNQRIVRESESVGDGVVVKRILPEGAILEIGDHEILLKPE